MRGTVIRIKDYYVIVCNLCALKYNYGERSMKKIIGIDPGLKGGIVGIEGNELKFAHNLPTFIFEPLSKQHGRLTDKNALHAIISGFKPDLIVVELPRGRSNLKTVINYGWSVLGAITAYGDCELIEVAANSWPPKLNLPKGGTKEQKILDRAKFLEGLGYTLPKNKVGNYRDGIVDALCLAEVGKVL